MERAQGCGEQYETLVIENYGKAVLLYGAGNIRYIYTTDLQIFLSHSCNGQYTEWKIIEQPAKHSIQD